MGDGRWEMGEEKVIGEKLKSYKNSAFAPLRRDR